MARSDRLEIVCVGSRSLPDRTVQTYDLRRPFNEVSVTFEYATPVAGQMADVLPEPKDAKRIVFEGRKSTNRSRSRLRI